MAWLIISYGCPNKYSSPVLDIVMTVLSVKMLCDLSLHTCDSERILAGQLLQASPGFRRC